MPRVNVSANITDESAVIPTQEGPSDFVLGIIDDELFPTNILGALGFTNERENGVVRVSSLNDWHGRLKSSQSTGFSNTGSGLREEPFFHVENGSQVSGNEYAGGTYERWPSGAQTDFRWSYVWNYIENYLQYGGRVTIFSAKSGESLAEVVERAKGKEEPVDAFASIFFTKNNDVRSVVNSREDCIAITAVPSENKAGDLGRGNPDINPVDLSGVPNNQGLAGATFYDGATFSYSGYTTPPAGVARHTFQRTFVANKGNTYSYPPGRAVFSVRYFDTRPNQSELGTTTDVVKYTRMAETSPSEEAFGVRGLTLDLSNSAIVNQGVTLPGNTFQEVHPNGAMRFTQFIDQEASSALFFTPTAGLFEQTRADAYINHLQSLSGVTYFENSRERASVGDIVVRNRLTNLLDNDFQIDFFGGPGNYVTPTITISPGTNVHGEVQQFVTWNNFRSCMVPSNWMDAFSYSVGGVPDINTDSGVQSGVGQIYPTRHDVSFDHFDGKITATPEFSIQGQESTNSVSLAEMSLVDITRTLDPDFDLLQRLYGATGSSPSTVLFNRFKDWRANTGGRFFGLTANYERQTKFFKETFNIFGSSGVSLDVADSSGNKPLDFWGCTCSKIPEFITTFNLIGLTPDVCIEVGPNTRTQDVTAEGSTYAAYIGFSEPYPRITVNGGVNIFGERIGFQSSLDAGSTLNRELNEKIANTPPENSNFVNPISGNNDTFNVNSLVFYPLKKDLSEGSSFALTADKTNYFGATHVLSHSNAPALVANKDVQNKKRNSSNLDSNYSTFTDIFTNSGQSVVGPYGPEKKQLQITKNMNELYNAECAQTLLTPVGGTYPGMIWSKGSPGASATSQFFGTSGVSLNGFNNEGIYLIAEIEYKSGNDSAPGFVPSEAAFNQQDVSYSNIFSSNADKFEFPIFGEKFSENSFENYSSEEESQLTSSANEIPFTSDIAGIFARQFRDLAPWFSPANQRVSSITDIIRERYHLSTSEQDDLYDTKVNFIKSLDGSLRLFGDKTFADSTSTFSRINVANLFIYLKKKLEPLGRRFLFEQNDSASRELFKSAAEPFLETLIGQRAISEFKVICDESNNTPDIVDSNQFVVEILIKPVKTINFIRLRLNNAGSSFELE